VLATIWASSLIFVSHFQYQLEVIIALADLIRSISKKPELAAASFSCPTLGALLEYLSGENCALTPEGLQEMWWALSSLCMRSSQIPLLEQVR